MDVRRQSACRPETIERFFDNRLTADEQAAFERHLEACPDCRSALEAKAAAESWWRIARDCLTASNLALPLREGRGEGESLDAESLDGPHEGTRSWPEAAESAADGPSFLAAIKPFLNPTDDPRMLGRVGAYEIAGVIGSGGNGVVLKGFDAALSRYVAIKLLSPRLADSAAARRRFSREAQAAAAVVHENVMAIHAVAETHGLPYLVMPYARGPSLESRLRASGPLALEEVLRVGRQVAAGLAAAHAQGLVHRDIKPANILLEEGVERVKITDFGLARAIDDASLTRSGVIAGTPQYMSPEQARGEPVDHRADLFSLGCVLYAACAGRSPFRAETSYGVLRKICESRPRDLRELNPAIPLWLVRLVERLLAKEPSQRFDSAAEVAALFEQCLAHVQQPTTIALPSELIEPRRRRALSFYAAAALVLLVSGGLAVWAWQPPSSRRAGDVSPPVEPAAQAAIVAPAEQGANAHPWDDRVEREISQLSAGIDQLGAEAADDLWNDSLASQIDQLTIDVGDLESSMSDLNPVIPLEEKKP